MQLILFDIDGTLTQSNKLDNFAFLQALSDVFNLSVVNPDWSSFTHGFYVKFMSLTLDILPASKKLRGFIIS
jgi:beta-phosphoglucomutase-like phosphatase (HAD superfamily)